MSQKKRTVRTKPRRVQRARRVRPAAEGRMEKVKKHLEREVTRAKAPRWNADKDDVQRSVVKLVLTLVEFLRQLMERQAIRRMEARTLNDAELEAVGKALMQLEETIVQLCRQFEIPPEELNLELGPLGRLI